MDLTDVARALRRFWLPSAAVFILTVLAGYVAATRGGTSFESTATIAVAPNPAVADSADNLSYQIPLIVERVGTRSFREGLSSRISDDLLADVKSLEASNEVDTGIIRITAEGATREATAEAANAAAAEIVELYTPSELFPETQTATTANAVIVEIIDEATPEGGSVQDDFLPVMLASVVLGAILAVGAAVVAQRSSHAFDPAVRFRNEVGVPVLAVIPNARELSAADLDLSELLRSGPPPLVEAFQGLRTRIEVSLRDAHSALAITSWQRNEGRTMITAGLGLALSAIGQETVVIDTDLSHPQLHERLGEPFLMGLSEFGKLGRPNIIAKTHHPNLELVAAGIAKSHPAQILARALPETLEEIKVESPEAAVLLDAPPLHPVRTGGIWVQQAAETSTVLRTADRVLLVADASSPHLPELAVAVERLQEDGMIVVGAVLNRRHRGMPWRR